MDIPPRRPFSLLASIASMSHKESFVDVLVIGAGPAGLMCAHGLAKLGVNVRIIDQRWVLR